ncbi:hypothetical protein LSH36_178g02044 [Paralvinella palmiformis]|uniref:Uncharacterized protein n=1 Tax=Paralvinella palmiformis TaxID=53620 RepID=A0AAD9N603_9ANNE|nr:hypothetical protein LSH36_178g02044 [Paralvinella palmiformis]
MKHPSDSSGIQRAFGVLEFRVNFLSAIYIHEYCGEWLIIQYRAKCSLGFTEGKETSTLLSQTKRFGAETVAYWAQPPGVDFCGVLMLLLLVLSIIGVFQGKWDGERNRLLDMRKMQRRHDEEEEDQEEEDVIPNFEIDDGNGDANGLEYEYEMTEDEVLQTADI